MLGLAVPTVLAALLPLAPAGGEGGAPPPILKYEVAEKVQALTPAGERTTAVAGTVWVSGSRARWELSSGTFPRATATAALADGEALLLLDAKEKLAARAEWKEFEGLFRGPAASESGLASFALKGLAVSVTPEGAGRPVQGHPARRFAVRLTYTLEATLPGQVSRTKVETKGVLETVEELAEARSRFDDVTRLLVLRDEAKEALANELAKAPGFPVLARFESSAERTVEAFGGPPGSGEPPVRTTSRSERVVTRPERLVAGEEAPAFFWVPDGYRTRPLDRLLKTAPGLP